MKVSDADQKLDDAKKKRSALKSQLAESTAKLATMKVDYEGAVNSGADEAKLDELDAALYKAERERVRVEIRLNQCNAEITDLQRERESAQREAEDLSNREDEAAAVVESEELESLVQSLTQKASVHWSRLQRMRTHAQARGCLQVPYKLSNLERRISAIFRGGSVVRAFEQTYPTILRGNIASVARQIGGKSSVIDETATEHTDAEQAIIIN